MLSVSDVKNIALGLIGGSPLMKAASVVAEKLKIIKSVEGGDLGPLLAMVMSGGGGSILQNPVGAALGSLNGQISSVAGSLSSVAGFSGAGGLGEALSGLSAAASTLGNFTNALSGLADGAIGPLELISASNISDMLGSSLPTGLGIDAITAPLRMASGLSDMVGSLSATAEGVLSGAVALPDAISSISDMATTINSAVTTATAAHDTLASAASALSSVSAMAAIASGSGGSALQGVFQSMIQPQHLATIAAAAVGITAT